MNLQLLKHPNSILTTKINDKTYPTVEEAEQSYAIMKLNHGVGIAAPQVGISKRFFWFNDELVINPEIIHKDAKLLIISEGCLSLPGESWSVIRHFSIIVKYKTYLGKFNKDSFITAKLTGINSVIFQHEYDHLEGIMINNISHRQALL